MTVMVTGHRKLLPAGMEFGSPWPDQNVYILIEVITPQIKER